MTEKDIKMFQKILIEEKKKLEEDIVKMQEKQIANGNLIAQGELSIYPDDMGDVASENYEIGQVLDFLKIAQRALHEVNRALEKIDKGNFGKCEVCEINIDKKRIKAKPWARFCSKCRKTFEREISTRK